MSEDLIKRSDVYKAVDDWFAGRVSNLNIKDIPSADRPSAVDLSSVYSTAYKSGYDKGYADAVQGIADEMVKQGKCIVQDRPQGEWTDVHANYKYVRACSECGWQHDVVHYGDSFCPHCGADMRPKIVGKHADFMMIDEACAKGADDE